MSIEVLSDSTEAYDRGEKFELYRRLGSLPDDLLISQNKQKIEHFRRQSEAQWNLSESFGTDDCIEFESISCRLPLQDVYDKVELKRTGLRPDIRRVR